MERKKHRDQRSFRQPWAPRTKEVSLSPKKEIEKAQKKGYTLASLIARQGKHGISDRVLD